MCDNITQVVNEIQIDLSDTVTETTRIHMYVHFHKTAAASSEALFRK